MKLSPFMKQVKKWLKKLTKKQLIEKVIIWTEIWAQENISNWKTIYELQELCESNLKELIATKKKLAISESALQACESANQWYENMSILQFIKHKHGRKR